MAGLLTEGKSLTVTEAIKLQAVRKGKVLELLAAIKLQAVRKGKVLEFLAATPVEVKHCTAGFFKI
jgi:predicted Zn-ribbon and HTH transcriptional regulator